MDFESDALIEQLARKERKETFGLIICALFHQPKPRSFAEFYQQLIGELKESFTDDEKQAIYLYPIEQLHITISTLFSFKHDRPESPERCLEYWKDCFKKLKERTSKDGPLILSLESIPLSKAAGYFLFQDESNAIEKFRQSIREVCIPEPNQPALQIPNIVHTSFLRFIRKPLAGPQLEEKFHRICTSLLSRTPSLRFEISEVCLAFESSPYMHIACDDTHVLDILQF